MNNLDFAGTLSCPKFAKKACGAAKAGGRQAVNVYRYNNVSFGGCIYVCANITFAHGHLYGSTGGLGLRGVGVGYTSATPEQQGSLTIQSCGAVVMGGCGMIGDRAGSRTIRNARGDTFHTKNPWWGYNVQIGVGASSGGMYTRRIL